MFRRMKLASMLWGGFGLLIVVIVGLGGVAIWTMVSVRAKAQTLTEEYVPEMVLTAQTERSVFSTMYNMRAYGLTGEQKYLDLGRQYLAEVQESLRKVSDLTARSSGLHKLAEALPALGANVESYEQFINETDTQVHSLATNQDRLDQAADQFMDACRGLLTHQQETLQQQLEAGGDREIVERCLNRITLTTAIIDLGAELRVKTWKGQAQRDVQVMEQLNHDFEQIHAKFAQLGTLSQDPGVQQHIEAAEAATLAYQTTSQNLVDNSRALRKLQQGRDTVAEALLAKAEAAGRRGGDMAVEIADDTSEAMATAYISMVTGLGVAAVLGVSMALLIIRAVTRKLVGETKQLMSASSELKAAAQQQLSGASEQSTAANEVSAAMRELAATAEQIVERTEQVSAATNEAVNRCDQGRMSVDQAQEVMREIRQQVEKVVEHMLDLNAKAQEINMATEIITELSEQTTILSYNAAIEAAAAGDAGQSFAVVADQVGKLADRAKEAARDVRSLIEDVQKATSTTVMATEDGLRAADRGLKAQDEASQTMVAVADGIRASLDSVREIELSSRQQSSASEQVGEGMNNVVTAARQSETSSKQTLATADQLLSTANTLKDL